MFTGIITAVGNIVAAEKTKHGQELRLRVETGYPDLTLGESVAVNGACLTVAELMPNGVVDFFVSQETFTRTNLKELSTGQHVNLERALRMADRLSGHMVSGHVDTTAKLSEIRQVGESYELRVTLPEHALRYALDKGSIALDGISLTINSINKLNIYLMIIPHTWAHTTLKNKRVGQDFNVELDMVVKTLEKLMPIQLKDLKSNAHHS